jgi:hypothetical protein
MMAVALFMHWPGVTAEQYDEVRRRVDWEGNPADGGMFHVVGFGDDGMRIADIWESPDHFERFGQERFMPVVQELGVTSEPKVEIVPVHAIFAPMYGGANA